MKLHLIITLVAVSSLLKAQTGNFSTPAMQHCDTHLVSHGETLYSLSKTYHTSVDELLKLNPDILNNNLQQGKVIRVPITKDETLTTNSDIQNKSDHPIIHKVEKGETVYSISKKYNIDLATILMWNDLKNPAIREGQNLIVAYETPQMRLMGPFPTVDTSYINSNKNENQCGKLANHKNSDSCNKRLALSVSGIETPDLISKTPSEKDNVVAHDEKGVATWTYSSYDQGNFYALHSTAPQGTIITVRNLMNSKTVSVKVIGKLPSTSDNENILIKLSESAAKKLNVFDEKFLVEINYMALEEISLRGIN